MLLLGQADDLLEILGLVTNSSKVRVGSVRVFLEIVEVFQGNFLVDCIFQYYCSIEVVHIVDSIICSFAFWLFNFVC